MIQNTQQQQHIANIQKLKRIELVQSDILKLIEELEELSNKRQDNQQLRDIYRDLKNPFNSKENKSLWVNAGMHFLKVKKTDYYKILEEEQGKIQAQIKVLDKQLQEKLRSLRDLAPNFDLLDVYVQEKFTEFLQVLSKQASKLPSSMVLQVFQYDVFKYLEKKQQLEVVRKQMGCSILHLERMLKFLEKCG